MPCQGYSEGIFSLVWPKIQTIKTTQDKTSQDKNKYNIQVYLKVIRQNMSVFLHKKKKSKFEIEKEKSSKEAYKEVNKQ